MTENKLAMDPDDIETKPGHFGLIIVVMQAQKYWVVNDEPSLEALLNGITDTMPTIIDDPEVKALDSYEIGLVYLGESKNHGPAIKTEMQRLSETWDNTVTTAGRRN